MNRKFSIYLAIIFMGIIVISGCKSSKKVADTADSSSDVKEVPPPPPPVKEPVETEPEKNPEELSLENKLENYFQEIAGASDPSMANRNIDNALKYFESKDAPVFIVFYKADGNKDYDKPTTIDKYLNYIKDQKKNPNKIDKLIFNDQGQITEIELTKR